MKALLLFTIGVAVISLGIVAYYQMRTPDSADPVACTMDAMICPDGTVVGRVGPSCEFAPCPTPPEPAGPVVPADVQAHIESKSDLIVVDTPAPLEVIESPLRVTGEARGTWFFEASFPVTLVNWDGLIIAQGIATADGEWMTEDFVPFAAELEFTKPDFDARGTLILKKDNPSGLPENDDALEIPIRFDETLSAI